MHDFDLHAPIGANKPRRIVGRGQGSGRGTTSGKGNKGQQARSGGKTYLGFEGGQMPLYRRLAHRGFSNCPFKKVYKALNIGELAVYFDDGETVDAVSLAVKGVSKSKLPVKILGEGECSKKLNISGVRISAPAREKVIKAGGTVVLPPDAKERKKSSKSKKSTVKEGGQADAGAANEAKE
ncbi:MAG: 50S ribosomal protein L15 [Spirochaetaceae bacterium]|jgi:large subunit ribosomal protein L15|nr:50S ribosomal protein L15 [Spirochaetaceae bacterium]